MKKVLSNNRNKVYLILAGIFLLIGTYRFVYVETKDKITVLDGKVSELETHLAELEKFESKREFYLEETDKCTKGIEDIKKKVPSDLRSEDLTMYLKNSEDECNIAIYDAAYSDELPIEGITKTNTSTTSEQSQSTEDQNQLAANSQTKGNSQVPGQEGQVQGDSAEALNLIGCKRTVSLQVNAEYNDMKKFLWQLTHGKHKLTIQSITMNVDATTGGIGGQIDFDYNYIKNSGAEYEPEYIPTGISGKKNLFNTAR